MTLVQKTFARKIPANPRNTVKLTNVKWKLAQRTTLALLTLAQWKTAPPLIHVKKTILVQRNTSVKEKRFASHPIPALQRIAPLINVIRRIAPPNHAKSTLAQSMTRDLTKASTSMGYTCH